MQLVPHLTVKDGFKALEFYKAAFGAEVGTVHPTPDGSKVFHAELKIGDAQLMLCDEFDGPDMGCAKSAATLGGTPVNLTLFCDDAESLANQAVAAGAEVIMPVADQFWGGKYGQVRDPFGHVWAFNQQVRQVSDAEMKEATDAIFAQA